jgi:hypothetical protein
MNMKKIFTTLVAIVLLPSAYGDNPNSVQRIREVADEEINSKVPALVRRDPNAKGEKGDTGAQDPSGPQGPAGADGAGGVSEGGAGIQVSGAGTAAIPYQISKVAPEIGDVFAEGRVGGVQAMSAGGKVVGFKVVVCKEVSDSIYGLNGINMSAVNGIENGRILTNTIIALKTANTEAAFNAAQQCAREASTGILTSDWYLPAFEELLDLVARLNTATANTLSNASYWSSTPQHNSPTQAIGLNGSTGAQVVPNLSRLDTHKVVCVRDVYI